MTNITGAKKFVFFRSYTEAMPLPTSEGSIADLKDVQFPNQSIVIVTAPDITVAGMCQHEGDSVAEHRQYWWVPRKG